MKQITLSSKRVYRTWRPGWQVGTSYIVVSLVLLIIFKNGIDFGGAVRCRGMGCGKCLQGTSVLSVVWNREEVHEPFQHAQPVPEAGE